MAGVRRSVCLLIAFIMRVDRLVAASTDVSTILASLTHLNLAIATPSL